MRPTAPAPCTAARSRSRPPRAAGCCDDRSGAAWAAASAPAYRSAPESRDGGLQPDAESRHAAHLASSTLLIRHDVPHGPLPELLRLVCCPAATALDVVRVLPARLPEAPLAVVATAKMHAHERGRVPRHRDVVHHVAVARDEQVPRHVAGDPAVRRREMDPLV